MAAIIQRPMSAAVDMQDYGNGVEVRWRARSIPRPRRVRSRKRTRPTAGTRTIVEALLMAVVLAVFAVARYGHVWPGGVGL